jgi:hypothetical protein
MQKKFSDFIFSIIENIKSDLFTGKVFGEPVTLQVTNHLELPVVTITV